MHGQYDLIEFIVFFDDCFDVTSFCLLLALPVCVFLNFATEKERRSVEQLLKHEKRLLGMPASQKGGSTEACHR
jgi:hypothetical protein